MVTILKHILLVFIGGGAGSVLRYMISAFLSKYQLGNFPVSTFVVNAAGSLLIGLLISLIQKYTGFADEIRYLFIIGFCGGFTTFSTFSAEGLSMIQAGNYILYILYATASVVVCALACWAGFKIMS